MDLDQWLDLACRCCKRTWTCLSVLMLQVDQELLQFVAVAGHLVRGAGVSVLAGVKMGNVWSGVVYNNSKNTRAWRQL